MRRLPRPVWILCAGSFVNRFGSFVLTFLVLYLDRRGFSAGAAGLALASYGVGALVAAAAGGYLADRLGRRTTIAMSMFSAAGTMLLLSGAGSLPAIVALTGMAGLTAELYRPASSALLTDLVPDEDRVTAFGLYRLAINAGFAVGPAVAGVLAERSFGLLFAGDALTSAVFGVVALTALPAGVRSARSAERRGETVRAVLSDRAFVLFLLASLCASFIYFQATASFPLHVRDSGLSSAAFGLLISLNGIVIVLIELPLTGLTARLRARPVIAAGVLLTGVGFALTGLASSLPALAATVLVWTAGEMVSAPVSSAYVAALAPTHLRGRYQGTWGLTFGLGFILAPAGGLALYGVSPGALWLSCGILGAVAAALVMAGRERTVGPAMVESEPGPEIPGVER